MKKILSKTEKTLITIAISVLALVVFGASVFVGFEFYGVAKYNSCKTQVVAPEVTSEVQVFMSYNLRTNSKDDILNKTCYARAPHILDDINAIKPDILACQEVQDIHYAFMCEHLVGYGNVRQERDETTTESCPIFYNESRYTLIDSGTFWLSETPDVPESKSWGSYYPRICTYVILRDTTGYEFAVFNAHPSFDKFEMHDKQLAVVAERAKNCGYPVVIIGDMNSDYGDDALANFDFVYNTRQIAVNPNFYTLTDYLSEDGYESLDHIFIPKDATIIECDRYVNLAGGFHSDHYPIYSKITFGK